jgi:hypothetical protein
MAPMAPMACVAVAVAVHDRPEADTVGQGAWSSQVLLPVCTVFLEIPRLRWVQLPLQAVRRQVVCVCVCLVCARALPTIAGALFS